VAISPHIARLRSFVGTELLLMPAAAVLVRDGGGRLLLVRHTGDHRWGVPGGALEPGETPAAGAVGEVLEETGVEVRLRGIVDVVGGPGFEVRYGNGDRVAYVSTIYDGVATGGTARPDEDEIAEVRWCERAEVDGLELTPYARSALAAAGLLGPDPGFTHDVRVRYAECDQQGIVFNANYLIYADDAVDAWFTAMLAPGFDCMVRKATVEWAGPARHGETLTLRPRVSRWGRTSFDVTISGAVGARRVFEAVLHYVSVAPGSATPTPVPEAVRAGLSRPVPRRLLETERLVLRRFTPDDDAQRMFGCFAAHDRASGAFVGWFSLLPGADVGEVEVDHRVADGFADEGTRALVGVAFGEPAVRRVHTAAGTVTRDEWARMRPSDLA